MSVALVTGGAGFIGSHLVDRLIDEDFEVIVLDNFFTGNLENLRSHMEKPKFRLIKGDIRRRNDVKKAIKGVDHVFHLAAIVSVELSMKKPKLVNEVNVNGTLNLLEESVKANVEKFIYISSCAVYGEPTYLPIDEKHPTNPISPYGASKLAAEHYCRTFHKAYGLKTTCLRLFNVYGPRQRGGTYGGVITKFIEKLKNKQSPVIFGDGKQTRDFIHVNDVITAILLTLKNEQSIGESINIGSGTETSINELAEILIKTFGLENVKPKHVKGKAGDIKHSCADISKAKELLDFKPKISLEEGLRRLVIEFDAK